MQQYVEAADRLIADAIVSADLERAGDPLLDQARALVDDPRTRGDASGDARLHLAPGAVRAQAHASGISSPTSPRVARANVSLRARIPSGVATLGTDLREAAFAWDNECPAHQVQVDAFSIDIYNVTNEQFMEFVEAGGYRDRAWWRPDDWAWIESDSIRHPLVLGAQDGDAGSGEGCSSVCRCLRLARVCHVG